MATNLKKSTKTAWEIFSIFVAFSEYLTFINFAEINYIPNTISGIYYHLLIKVQRPKMPHFKAFCMINFQYEIRNW